MPSPRTSCPGNHLLSSASLILLPYFSEWLWNLNAARKTSLTFVLWLAWPLTLQTSAERFLIPGRTMNKTKLKQKASDHSSVRNIRRWIYSLGPMNLNVYPDPQDDPLWNGFTCFHGKSTGIPSISSKSVGLPPRELKVGTDVWGKRGGRDHARGAGEVCVLSWPSLAPAGVLDVNLVAAPGVSCLSKWASMWFNGLGCPLSDSC